MRVLSCKTMAVEANGLEPFDSDDDGWDAGIGPTTMGIKSEGGRGGMVVVGGPFEGPAIAVEDEGVWE